MIGRGLACLLLLVASAEARVDFEHSSIFDEFDFQGQASVTVNDLCSSTCRIYASITSESKKLAGNILIQQQKGFVSVADVAARVDPASGQKLFLQMSNIKTLTIANTNAQNAAGPLVLYIVRDAQTYNEEIYEAEGLNRTHRTLPRIMTVLSAQPFTLTQPKYAMSGAKQTASVTMTGYDATNTGGVCKTFYHETFTSPFPGFTFEVNGPIITIAWENHGGKTPQSEMVATLGISNTQQVAVSGWVGSPGYHGCLDKQPYRSSLYDFHSDFHADIISKDELYIIYMTIETNANLLHEVHFTDTTTHIKYPISNSPADNPITLYMRIDDLAIDWKPVADTFFLGRWNSSLTPERI